MKYILRIIIVIAIIVGIIFGIRFCSTRMSNEAKICNQISNGYDLISGKSIKTEIDKIVVHLETYDELMKDNEDFESKLSLANSQLNLADSNYKKIEKYLAEIYFLSNITNKDIDAINEKYDTLDKTKKEISSWVNTIKEVTINSQNAFSVSNTTMSRYIEKIETSLASYISTQKYLFVYYGEYILKYNYNETVENTNYIELKSTIEELKVEG